MPYLRVISGPFADRTYSIGDECLIGRADECPFHEILRTDMSVSNRHAVIMRGVVGYRLRDDSKAGSYVNQIPVHHGEVALADCDRIRMCSFEFEFRAGELPSGGDDRAHVAERQTRFVDTLDETRIESEISTQYNSGAAAAAAAVPLAAVVEVIGALEGSLELPVMLEKLLATLFAIFPQAERGLIGLCDGAKHAIVPTVVKLRHGRSGDRITVSRMLVHHLFSTKTAVLCRDTTIDLPFRDGDSIRSMPIRSVMCVPLLDAGGGPLGMIQLDSPVAGAFQTRDLWLFASLAPQAAFACQFARLHQEAVQRRLRDFELSLARQVQLDLLPQRTPALERYQFFQFYQPARELGGDFFDYIPLPDGRLAVVEADVEGKSVAAALIVSRLVAEVSHLLRQQPTIAAAVAELNRTLCARREPQIVTLAVLVLDSQRHEVTVVNAGHPPPIFRGSAGLVSDFGSAAHGLLLGVDAHQEYAEHSYPLAVGDLLVLYTDGLSEARNPPGDEFGTARLEQIVGQGGDAETVGTRLVSAVRDFASGAEQADDMCLVCLQRTA